MSDQKKHAGIHYEGHPTDMRTPTGHPSHEKKKIEFDLRVLHRNQIEHSVSGICTVCRTLTVTIDGLQNSTPLGQRAIKLLNLCNSCSQRMHETLTAALEQRGGS